VASELLEPTDAAIRRAAAALASGEVVVIPTETVYGLAARADDAAPLGRIYELKGRPSNKPLIVHVRNVTQAREYARAWPDIADRLASTFWPGPLTLVLPKRHTVLDEVTAGGPTVAVRVPDHDVAQRLLAACPFALAAPSANLSGRAPPSSAQEAQTALAGRVSLILDGGSCRVGEPSTIVSITADGATLLRRGALAEEIAAALKR